MVICQRGGNIVKGAKGTLHLVPTTVSAVTCAFSNGITTAGLLVIVSGTATTATLSVWRFT